MHVCGQGSRKRALTYIVGKKDVCLRQSDIFTDHSAICSETKRRKESLLELRQEEKEREGVTSEGHLWRGIPWRSESRVNSCMG